MSPILRRLVGATTRSDAPIDLAARRRAAGSLTPHRVVARRERRRSDVGHTLVERSVPVWTPGLPACYSDLEATVRCHVTALAVPASAEECGSLS